MSYNNKTPKGKWLGFVPHKKRKRCEIPDEDVTEGRWIRFVNRLNTLQADKDKKPDHNWKEDGF